MTNREKMLQEMSEMDGKELFQVLSSRYPIDVMLCADCQAQGHTCPENCDCSFEREWMDAPCTREKMLEVSA
jgi:hypothetical protein